MTPRETTTVFSLAARRARANRLRAAGGSARRKTPRRRAEEQRREARRVAGKCVRCGVADMPRGKRCDGCREEQTLKCRARREA